MLEMDERIKIWQQFNGPNLGYIKDMYELFIEDPQSIEPEWSELFTLWGDPSLITDERLQSEIVEPQQSYNAAGALHKAVAAAKLAQYIRFYGHLSSRIDPLDPEKAPMESLNLEAYNLSEADLRRMPVDIVWPHEPGEMQSAFDAVVKLKQLYTNTLAFQFSHVHEEDEILWLNQMVETGGAYRSLSAKERIHLLKSLMKVEQFERFIHRTFVGQKRFSVEGLDVLIPMVDETVREGVRHGAKQLMIGMAHRGRLNMLAHVLGKPYEEIFAEFQHAPNKDLVPSEGSIGLNYGWTGDVSYHMGAELELEEETLQAMLTLANNPSHLEFVNPVVEGYTRAAQEDRHQPGTPKQDTERAFAIIIHGDAAFPGEGIVAETLNLSRLSGYHIGGTIHVIANNQIGFTTGYAETRSTKYASDLAEGFEIPVVHVNADDPEACLAAVHLASEYRKRFKKDFLIDLIGYRRFGHNEMDDPEATQPLLYEKINRHTRVRQQYAERLIAEGIITAEDEQLYESEIQQRLQDAYEQVKTHGHHIAETINTGKMLEPRSPAAQKAVSFATLEEINHQLLQWPDDFNPYPKLKRFLERRLSVFEEKGKVDWALAETLAFATILQDGIPIRFTGQDTERGTFAHRHMVLHDYKSGAKHTPLKTFSHAGASFAIYNSPLSEAAVLGFEYGYNVFARESMVLWEAQFGDFGNAAQVIIDQFIVSGQAKWRQMSDMVLLLPHGYEGQGPEHSSARLERFLQLTAELNFTVANLTSAAQYFHLLRQQASMVGTKGGRPLVIMTPKSLLRNPHTASDVTEFSEGQFQPVIECSSNNTPAERVKRLILCSGKVAVDLLEAIQSSNKDEISNDAVHILRVEQLYPFPKDELVLKWESYKQLTEIVWVQEEPKNMGAWSYMEPRLREIAPADIPIVYIGRPERSSTAEGSPDAHKEKQHLIIQSALSNSL